MKLDKIIFDEHVVKLNESRLFYFSINRSLVSSVKERVDEIIKIITSVFNTGFHYWEFIYPNYSDSDDEFSDEKDEKLFISSIEEYKPELNQILPLYISGVKNIKILYKNIIIDLQIGFPVHWLFEDFETELISCKKAMENFLKDEELKKKQKSLAEKEKKDKLIQSIKSKLTLEELKILKVK